MEYRTIQNLPLQYFRIIDYVLILRIEFGKEEVEPQFIAAYKPEKDDSGHISWAQGHYFGGDLIGAVDYINKKIREKLIERDTEMSIRLLKKDKGFLKVLESPEAMALVGQYNESDVERIFPTDKEIRDMIIASYIEEDIRDEMKNIESPLSFTAMISNLIDCWAFHHKEDAKKIKADIFSVSLSDQDTFDRLQEMQSRKNGDDEI